MEKRILIVVLFLIAARFGAAGQPHFIVAQDGSGNFKTVQQAINAVPDFRKAQTIIFIKAGVYKEKLVLAPSKRRVKLVGESVDRTIITFDDYNSKRNYFGEIMETSGSASVYIHADDLIVESITFENTSGPVGPAVAVWSGGDRTIFKNCHFIGFQDTLYTYGAGNRQFFIGCHIEGTVDFIFGPATAVFSNCNILCKGKGYVTAASTPDSVKFGYAFLNCRVKGTADADSFYLGRPWRPWAKVVFLNCELAGKIRPEGWNNWRKKSNEKTAFYAEYNNRGEGARPDKRVEWSHQLTLKEAQRYSIKTIFKGWDPEAVMSR